MAKNKKNKNFALTPEMQKFQYEVAQEIGLVNQFDNPELNPQTQLEQGLGKRNKKKK